MIKRILDFFKPKREEIIIKCEYRRIKKLQQKIKTHILEIIGEILFTVAALILIYIIIY